MVRALLILAISCAGASAQANTFTSVLFCDKRGALVDKLERNLGAVQQGQGIREPGKVMELWSVPSTGEWSLIQTYADGTSCVIASGEYWEALAPTPDPA